MMIVFLLDDRTSVGSEKIGELGEVAEVGEVDEVSEVDSGCAVCEVAEDGLAGSQKISKFF